MTTYAVNDPIILGGLSPGAWYRNGASYVRCNNGGNYARYRFTGTSFAAAIDLSSFVGYTPGPFLYPFIALIVDGVLQPVYALTSSDTGVSITGLADTTHTVELVVAFLNGFTPGLDRWNTPRIAVTITSFAVDTGRAILAATPKAGGTCYFFDDSTGENAVQDATNDYPALNSWPYLLAQAMDFDFGNCSFSGQSWTGGLHGNVPGLPDSWDEYSNGLSRLGESAPDYVICGMGYNDQASVTRSIVSGWIEAVRAAWPQANINFAYPINYVSASTATTAIYDGVMDYRAAHPSDDRVFLFDGNGAPLSGARTILLANTDDGVHYTVAGGALLAAYYEPLVQGDPPGLKINVTTLNITTLNLG